MDSIDLDSRVTNPHGLRDLDIMKGESARPQNSTGSKPTAQHPLTGGDVQVRGKTTALILGQMGKKFLSPINRIFKKRVLDT